jgi:sulfide:quinone oxidoreductase
MAKKLVVLGAGIAGLRVIMEVTESGVSLEISTSPSSMTTFHTFLGFTLPWVMRGV